MALLADIVSVGGADRSAAEAALPDRLTDLSWRLLRTKDVQNLGNDFHTSQIRCTSVNGG